MTYPYALLATRQTLVDFSARLTSKWNRSTQPTTPQTAGKANIVDILRQLVDIPTITDNYAANHDALNYIEQYVSERGMHVKRLEWNGSESLVATTRRTKKPKVMLGAHIDVVSGEEKMFELREEGGRLYGRGVYDMKFAIAAYLTLVDQLQHHLSAYDFGIMITTDEEAGGFDGVSKLLEYGYRPTVCILPDGGDDWQIQTHAKGGLGICLSAQGISAHSSRPWLGDNAALRIIRALEAIYALFPDMSAASNTINLGKISGGNTYNQVPDRAEALLDIRAISESERRRVAKEISSICEMHGVQFELTLDMPVAEFSLTDPYIAPFAQAITEITGIQVTGSRTLGTNDARHFVPYNIPCISLYPRGGGHHGPEEWLDRQDLFAFEAVILRYVQDIASIDIERTVA